MQSADLQSCSSNHLLLIIIYWSHPNVIKQLQLASTMQWMLPNIQSTSIQITQPFIIIGNCIQHKHSSEWSDSTIELSHWHDKHGHNTGHCIQTQCDLRLRVCDWVDRDRLHYRIGTLLAFCLAYSSMISSNCKLPTMSFSMQSRDSALIRPWTIVVRSSFFTRFKAENVRSPVTFVAKLQR